MKPETIVIINRDTFNLSACLFLQGSIDRAKLMQKLGIKEEDFIGKIGTSAHLHLLKAASKQGSMSQEQMLIKWIEDYIRSNGRFHDEPEKPKKLIYPQQKRNELLKDMEAALKAGNQDAFNKLSLELAKAQEEEIKRLQGNISHTDSWHRTY